MNLFRTILLAGVPAIALGLAACGGDKPAAPAAGDSHEEVAASGDTAMAGVIEARQKNFKTIGKNFKAIGDSMKAGNVAGEESLAAISTIAGLAPELKSWFPEGSGPEAGVKTEAKADIWTDPSGFDEQATAFQAAVLELAAAGESGDAATISAAFTATYKTCKGCHDTFKEEDEH